MDISVEPFSRAAFTELADFLGANALARLPAPSLLLPGDLAWRLPGSAPKENLQLFRHRHTLLGFAWFEPFTGFEFDLRHDLDLDHPIVASIFDWAQSRRKALPPAYPRFIDFTSMADWAREIEAPRPQESDGERYLTTIAFESDQRRIERLQQCGYAATDHFAPLYRRDLSLPVEAVPLAAGCRLRSVTPADLPARVAVHRSAWLGSSWTPERYRQIRATPVYDPSLDIVLDTGGEFASYCICWADEVSGTGIFEPVGTHPQWRGKGVGRAVILEGLRRLAAHGMRYAQVATAGFNAPAQALYESSTFAQQDTARTFMKRVR